MDFIKICNVSFHCWLCHRINDTATFSCDTKPVERPTEERQRQLTPDEVESLRKRNECEQRFYDNKIYEIHGMSVMAACKQTRKEGPDSDMDDSRRCYPLWEATKSLSKASFWLGALFFGMYWMGYFLTPEEQHLAQKYHVSQDAVFIAPKPHRCDFDDAPVGKKDCHFDRKEGVARDEQGKITVSVTWEKVPE